MRLLPDSDPSAAVREAEAALLEAESGLLAGLTAVRSAMAEIALVRPSQMGPLMSLSESEAALHIKRTRLFALVRSGDLTKIKLGAEICISRASVDDFLARLGAA
jgi:hypothetical protein